MSRRLLTLPLCLAALGAVPTVADAASTTRYPTIAQITPMRAGIGETMTITGRNFRVGQRRNTVVFKRDNRPAVFVKADTATATRLTIILPEKLRPFLGRRDGTAVATRFRIRVLARRFSRGYTRLANSPVILPTAARAGATGPSTTGTTNGPAPVTGNGLPATAAGDGGTGGGNGTGGTPAPNLDCDGDGDPDVTDNDDDNDLLGDVTEVALNTNRCAKDTDGDGMEDGWEWKSAYDLNQESCRPAKYPTPCASATPYPAKRPYPNPLDATDLNYDYDGDRLPAWAEHKAWLRHGHELGDLWYSDGLQASLDTSTSPICHGATVPAPLLGAADYSLDLDRNGCLTDDERDEDNDYLGNQLELDGWMSSPEIWKRYYKEPLYPLNYAGTDWLDADTDGDTRVDGLDDEDSDDFWNVEEVYRGAETVDKEDFDTGRRDGLWVNPFNPCLPSTESRTCMRILPVDGDVVRPFVRGDAKRADWPKPRWPLYGPWRYSWRYNGPALGVTTPENWSGMPMSAQTMPPMHPLTPRPGF